MFDAYFLRNKVATGYILGTLATLIAVLYFGLVAIEHSPLDDAS